MSDKTVIALGTTSDDKLFILNNVLKKTYSDKKFEIIGLSVESGVADQPMDEKTTRLGAKNRAVNALSKHSSADIGLGMEGGLVTTADNGMSLICICSVVNKDGKVVSAKSKKIPLPAAVSLEIRRGGQFGQKIREYKSRVVGKTSDKEIEQIDGLITREYSFTEAIKKALKSYYHVR